MEPNPERDNEYNEVMGVPDDEQPADEVEAEQQDADMADLFGDDEPAQEPGEAAAMNEAEEAEPLQPPPPPPAPEDDFMEYADTQEPMSPSAAAAAAVPQTEAEIMLVNLPQPSPSAAGQLYHTKLPSFLRIESQPFDPATFDPDAEEQLGPVSVESVLRWRWQQQQQQSAAPQKQSNSRIVTWSDGSKSLQVGQELFDVVLQPASTTGATYLVAAHDYATLAETQARISGHMTFVPSAVGSSTHAKLATGVSQRHVKTERTQTIQVHVDPMAQLAAEQAKEQARLRQQRKSRRKSQRARSDSGGSSADEGNLGGYRRGAGPRYAYESDDEDEAGFVVDDEEDAPDDGGADDLDRADRAAESRSRRDIDFEESDEEEAEAGGTQEPQKIDRRRMVVEGSDEE